MLRTMNSRFPLYRMLFLGLACFLWLAPRADAALSLSVGSIALQKPIDGPFSFSLIVSAQAVGQAEQINRYALPFDVDPAGTGLPAGLVLNGATQGDGSGLFLQSPAPGDDLLVREEPVGLSIPEGDSAQLFTLNFTATDLLAPGSYVVDLNELSSEYTITGPSSIGGISDGLITVTAVPEPGSMSAMALVAVGIAGVTRRRRIRNKRTQASSEVALAPKV